MQQDKYWQAVIRRNRNYDGKFVLVVISTKIYCQPSCPSRKPRRENVLFFSQPVKAENNGFRACKRSFSHKLEKSHLQLVKEVCDFIDKQVDNLPTLSELASKFNISQYQMRAYI